MSDKKTHKTSIGGQALIEGIMMRGPKGNAMSVRLPDGTIETELEEYVPLKKKCKLLGIPLIRGVAGFAESMITGYKYLMKSADKALTEEEKEEDMSKLDKWLNDHLNEKAVAVITTISSILGVVLAMAIFLWLPIEIVDLFDKYLLVNHDISKYHSLFEGILRIIIFILYMVAVSRMSMIKRVFMYHGAEHKCINCIERGRELTVKNVMSSSRLHKRCGTSFMLFVMMVSIVLFMFIKVEDPFMRVLVRILLVPVIAGISYEIIRLAGNNSNNILVKLISAPGMWLQTLTTKEPTEDMVEVAIKSVEAVFDWKEYLKEEFGYGVPEEDKPVEIPSFTVK